MRPEDLRKRMKAFALEVIEFCDRLPSAAKFQEIAVQLRRSANGMAANYRAAGRGRSHAEFTAKLGSALEEADESQHWLEMLAALRVEDERLPWLRDESNELVAILTASFSTATRRAGRQRRGSDDPTDVPGAP